MKLCKQSRRDQFDFYKLEFVTSKGSEPTWSSGACVQPLHVSDLDLKHCWKYPVPTSSSSSSSGKAAKTLRRRGRQVSSMDCVLLKIHSQKVKTSANIRCKRKLFYFFLLRCDFSFILLSSFCFIYLKMC